MFRSIGICLLALACACFAQETFFGSCSDHNVNITQDFNVDKYLGVWYEIERYESIYLFGSDCVVSNYTIKTNASVRVDITYKVGANERTVEGEAWMESPEKNDGRIRMLTPLAPESVQSVIGTDYENYSVVWFCTDFFLNNMQLLWVLSRKPQLSEEARTEVDRIISEAGFSKSRLRKTNNDASYCGYEENAI